MASNGKPKNETQTGTRTMSKLTIKQSDSSNITDLASEGFDRVINFGRSFKYAVVLPAYYGDIATRHKSAESVEKKLTDLTDYRGVRVFNRLGQECCFDDFDYSGKVRILCDAEDNGLVVE